MTLKTQEGYSRWKFHFLIQVLDYNFDKIKVIKIFEHTYDIEHSKVS